MRDPGRLGRARGAPTQGSAGGRQRPRALPAWLRALACALWLGASPGSPLAQGGGSDAGHRDGGPTAIEVPIEAMAPTVEAAAERGEALLGAAFTVFVTAHAGVGISVALREPVNLGSAFEVRRKLASVRTRGDGSHDYEWQLEVVAWEVGDLTLPPIAIVFEAHGQTGTTATAPAPVRIVGTLDEASTTPRELAPPRELTRSRPAWPLLAAAALPIVVLIAWIRWRRRRRPVGAGAAAALRPRGPRLSAYQQAQQRLDELERSRALTVRQKEGYVELAAVLYELVGALGPFGVADLTSGELVQRMKRSPDVASAAAAMERWLGTIDRVRYDAYVADEAQTALALAGARELAALLDGAPRATTPSSEGALRAAPTQHDHTQADAPRADATQADAPKRPVSGQGEP